MEVTVCEEHAVAEALRRKGEVTEAPPAGLAITVSDLPGVEEPEVAVVDELNFADPQPTKEKTRATERHFHNFI